MKELTFYLKLAGIIFLLALSACLIAFTALCIQTYNEPSEPYHYCK